MEQEFPGGHVTYAVHELRMRLRQLCRTRWTLEENLATAIPGYKAALLLGTSPPTLIMFLNGNDVSLQTIRNIEESLKAIDNANDASTIEGAYPC